MLDKIEKVGIGVLAIIAIFTVVTYEGTIRTLKDRVQELQIESLEYQKENAVCKAAIEDQNAALDTVRQDYKSQSEEFRIWQEQPPQVRYKTIYKTKVMEVKSNECEDIKNSIDAVRAIQFSKL